MKWIKSPLAKKYPVRLCCASLGGIGFLPAGGTWGSVVALLIAPFLLYCPFLIWGILILSFICGVWAIPKLIQNQSNKDPGYVIIDELLGLLLVYALIPYSFLNPLMYVMGFLFFRIFDILKPWPVSFFDQKMHNAWGIMLDDLMAGIYTICILALIQTLSIY